MKATRKLQRLCSTCQGCGWVLRNHRFERCPNCEGTGVQKARLIVKTTDGKQYVFVMDKEVAHRFARAMKLAKQEDAT